MHKNILIIFFVLLQNTVTAQKCVKIEFINEGKEIDITKNTVSLYLISADSNSKIVIKPKIVGDSFFTSTLIKDDQQFRIVVKYNDVFFGFGNIKLPLSQDMKWLMVFDKKPYDKEYSVKEVNDPIVKAIAYVTFLPLEEGDGIVSVISINNVKEYFRSSKLTVE